MKFQEIMNENHNNLLHCLPPNVYLSAEELASQLNVSVKTVRLRIKSINVLLNGNGARVESKPHHGYRLIINNEKLFKQFGDLSKQHERDKIPTIPANRAKSIIQDLLYSKKHIKIDRFCEKMYVSRSTISSEIKIVEKTLKKYDLNMIRKPYYGIQICGIEAKKRICLMDLYKDINNHKDGINFQQSSKLKGIKTILLETLNRLDLDISTAAFESLLIGLFVSEARIALGFAIDETEEENLFQLDEYILMIAEEIASKIKKYCGTLFSTEEIKYLAILIGGLCQLNENRVENIPIGDEIQHLCNEMVEKVYSGLGLDFRTNLDLRILLSRQLVPFNIRMKYNIPLDNPYLEEIKTRYMYAYIIASQACNALCDHYQKTISDKEIGNFALLFKLMLEKQGRTIKKKNILLICASGKVSAQLLATMYKKEFTEYVDIVKIRDIFSLKLSDFDDIDCAFTTVPIPFPVPKPVFEVDLFLDENEIKKIRDILQRENSEEVRIYYRKELFFSNINGNNRTEIIQDMCKRIKSLCAIQDDFQESVLKREDMLSTDYGNLVAFPHPCEPLTDETFACVGILDKPIFWKQNDVQVIILVSISKTKNSEKELHNFYESTVRLITNKKAINTLIGARSYDLLIDILSMNIDI